MKKILTYASLIAFIAFIAIGIFYYVKYEEYKELQEVKRIKEINSAKEMAAINAKIAEKLIPYKIIDKTINDKLNKLTLNIEVNVVNNRLPNKKELGELSKYLVRIEDKVFSNTWVFFFLPGMKKDAGAYATGHHNPNMKVEILDYVINNNYPQYKKYMK